MQNAATKETAELDYREQLYNDGAIGPIASVQLPEDAITSLRGILLDLDLKLLRASPLLPSLPENPNELYRGVVKGWLQRDPTLAKAEVRNSGTGLHGILRFADPVVFKTACERDRWAGIVHVVQSALPTDPDQPGIIATTRSIGSVNSKNGQVVELLAEGQPVTSDDVMSLYGRMDKSPFRTVFSILCGNHDIRPCPICGKPGTRLAALDYVGKCYGSCGKVGLDDLYDVVLSARTTDGAQRG